MSDRTTPEDRVSDEDIAQIVADNEAGVRDLLEAYESLEAVYYRAASAGAQRSETIYAANSSGT